jgi:hypothetical protein
VDPPKVPWSTSKGPSVVPWPASRESPPPPQIFVMNPGFTGQDSVLSQSPCQLVGCLGVPKGFNDQDPGFYDSPRFRAVCLGQNPEFFSQGPIFIIGSFARSRGS